MEPPPVIDAIVGPPGVGKTALEPRETIHWEEETFDPMIDIGKVADLALKWFACDLLMTDLSGTIRISQHSSGSWFPEGHSFPHAP